MKCIPFQVLTGFILAAAFITPHQTLFVAGPATVDLGSAAHFTILSGAAITTTGGGAINGDVGAYPITGAAIGMPAAQVHGTIYEVDNTGPVGAVVAPALLLAAKNDLTTAINSAAGRTPAPSGPFLDPGAGNIGGMNLIPGLYKFTSTASITGANLTLTGGPDDVWIFQIAADLQVGSAIQVVLAGGAQARNIFWQVGTSVAIGTFAVFKGSLLANQDIVMNTSSTLEGRAMSFTAGVVYNGNGGSLPLPEAPLFTRIFQPTTNSATIVLQTTPYIFLTLQTSTNLTNWSTLATNSPATNFWTFTNTNVMTNANRLFYRAFLTSPR